MLRAIAFLTLALSPSLLWAQDALPDYKQWRSACAKLPANRELEGKLPDRKLLPLPAFADFERALDAYLRTSARYGLAGRGGAQVPWKQAARREALRE